MKRAFVRILHLVLLGGYVAAQFFAAMGLAFVCSLLAMRWFPVLRNAAMADSEIAGIVFLGFFGLFMWLTVLFESRVRLFRRLRDHLRGGVRSEPSPATTRTG